MGVSTFLETPELRCPRTAFIHTLAPRRRCQDSRAIAGAPGALGVSTSPALVGRVGAATREGRTLPVCVPAEARPL